MDHSIALDCTHVASQRNHLFSRTRHVSASVYRKRFIWGEIRNGKVNMVINSTGSSLLEIRDCNLPIVDLQLVQGKCIWLVGRRGLLRISGKAGEIPYPLWITNEFNCRT